MDEFILDVRLKTDCLPVASLKLCDLLLMNDGRWPWVVLVPRITGAVEIHLLSSEAQKLLAFETSSVAAALAKISGCEKINSGALGNIVRQLHIHVIGRSVGDDGWPGPVWGYGQRRAYVGNEADSLINALKKELA